MDGSDQLMILVHIKKVEIFGFKSFGFKNTIIDFRPGLVSISGPNGSGKSNILDAIIFAMGENRPKIMRVDKLRSLMHDIEGGRRGPRMTRASVHLDNSDRGIPVDSDTIVVTREMDAKGENHYYLNKKKDSRSHIQDLLDIANAGLTNLNAVQQGTVTRISEFTPEEKRSSIADMIGLSDFDEKRDAAKKELDEADRRLDIALARMDEIKKQIDELEEARNNKLRYDMILHDLGRLRAVSAVQKIRIIKKQKDAKTQTLSEISADLQESTHKRDRLKQEIQESEAQKLEFIERVDAYNRAKATVDSDLSKAMKLYEETKNTVAITKKRIQYIEQQIPTIQNEIKTLHQKQQNLKSESSSIKELLDGLERKMKKDRMDLNSIDLQRQKVLEDQSQIAARKNETDKKIKTLYDLLHDAKLTLSKTNAVISDVQKRITANSDKLLGQQKSHQIMMEAYSVLASHKKNHQDTIQQLKTHIEQLSAKKIKLEHDLEGDQMLLEKSNKVAAQYETKIRVIKSAIPEDYTIAKLKDNAKRLGIVGLTYELLSWDKKYERAIIAAGSNWIKSIVVQDFTTLLGMAQVARERNLPRLKIIPLDAIPDFELTLPKENGVIGVLGDFVKCKPEHVTLKTFLFGNIILADSQDAAYRISKAGYKTVTLDGEFFESQSHAATIDINSRISKITKAISMSTEVDGLQQLNALLKRGNHKKKSMLRRLEDDIHADKDCLAKSEAQLAVVTQQRDDLVANLDRLTKTNGMLKGRINRLQEERLRLGDECVKVKSSVKSLEEQILQVQENYDQEAQLRIASELKSLNEKKSILDSQITQTQSEYHGKLAQLASLDAQLTKEETILAHKNNEITSLTSERQEQEFRVKELEVTMESRNNDLVKLREREQELISTSGTSLTQIQQYDDRLRELHKQDVSFTKSIGDLKRRSDSLTRDLGDLEEKHTSLCKIAGTHNFEEDIQSFDVEPLLQSLASEENSLKDLNAQAPKSYLDVSDGYRSMSDRKNLLEKERNAIVRIIEDVERQKKQMFLDAFDTVDKEIRNIFSKMTGGNAWLELQDEDDVSSSGISYLIQFPNKPKRESTSISGGEKTLAAIVYVLALQKLKPSPFYLFDEVDAHLDAPNSERLAKILEERSRESQFIMVSLKDSVVQRAKLIYGVYPKNGVSHMVTYKDKRLSSIVKT